MATKRYFSGDRDTRQADPTSDEQNTSVEYLIGYIEQHTDDDMLDYGIALSSRGVPLSSFVVAILLVHRYSLYQLLHVYGILFPDTVGMLNDDVADMFTRLAQYRCLNGIEFLAHNAPHLPTYAPGRSPMMTAMNRADIVLFDVLAQVGFTSAQDPVLPTDLNRCRFTIAINSDNLALLFTMCDTHRETLLVRDHGGDNVLHTATRHANPECLAIVANVLTREEHCSVDSYGHTALQIATLMNNHRCIDILKRKFLDGPFV